MIDVQGTNLYQGKYDFSVHLQNKIEHCRHYNCSVAGKRGHCPFACFQRYIVRRTLPCYCDCE